DFVAVPFAPAGIATGLGERLQEEAAQEIRLQLARLGPVHLFLDGEQVLHAHGVVDQGVALDDVLEVGGIEGAVDDAVEAVAYVGAFAVADRLDQQVLERGALERFAQDVEHLAAQRRALDFQLLEQALEHVAFAGSGGDHVPEVADLALADAVDAAEALLDAVRVPRQVVVDHEVGVLEVHALAGRVGGDQDQGVGILAEALLDPAALVAVGAA